MGAGGHNQRHSDEQQDFAPLCVVVFFHLIVIPRHRVQRRSNNSDNSTLQVPYPLAEAFSQNPSLPPFFGAGTVLCRLKAIVRLLISAPNMGTRHSQLSSLSDAAAPRDWF